MPVWDPEPDYTSIGMKVDAEFECVHLKQTIRRKLAADGAVSIWHQCDQCGHKVGIAIRKASMTTAALEALPLWGDQIEASYYAAKQKRLQELQTSEKDRLKREQDDHDAAWWRNYKKYLESPQWKHKRGLVLAREGGVCEGCREAKAVDVHHLTYVNVEHEFLFELVALCRTCHERWHDRADLLNGAPPDTQSEPCPAPKHGGH